MLRRLSIENYTVMSRVEVSFQPGLNVITGETGVGKSLLLDAVGSLLGEQRSSFPIRTGCDRAVIEGEFDPTQGDLIARWLEAHELPSDLPIILRREFQRSGRTRIFINDSPANLGFARELGDLLLDLLGQHEVVTLFDRARQLSLLDAFCPKPEYLNAYKERFGQLKALKEELSSLKAQIEDSQAGRDVLKRQLQELEILDPQPAEVSSIEAELNRLENSERIFQLCTQICDCLNEAPDSAVEHLTEAGKQLGELIPFYDSLKNWTSELENLRSVLVELNRNLQEISREVSYDPLRVEDLRQRHASLTGFRKRWTCGDKDLCDVGEDLRRQLAEMDGLSQRAGDLEGQIVDRERELIHRGKELSKHRQKMAQKLEAEVHQRLVSFGMEKARFKVLFEPPRTEHTYSDGLDRIEFALSPDGKIPHQPLRQVASGGEMSRILLALKSVLAFADHIETLVFDEIDQGISGRIARMVGLQLFELARSRQVIVVTHLPQIASLGDLHLSVRPAGEDGSASVHALNEEERLQELAALLAATGISDGALLNAREMLDSARSLRNAS